jgi:hypothetical protein
MTSFDANWPVREQQSEASAPELPANLLHTVHLWSFNIINRRDEHHSSRVLGCFGRVHLPEANNFIHLSV